MPNASEYDYKKLGLKCGIEIHQQLDTQTKLFCACNNTLRGQNPPDYTLIRTFRPVLGEEGSFDPAMLVEFKKNNLVLYEGFTDCTCTYDIDETPPFPCNTEAIDIALEIGLLLNVSLVDELHVCRKNYVDGSVPAGFQRTAIVGINGDIPISEHKNIGIELLCLEEDSCRRSGEKENMIQFRLDRLGIPLVEVTTAPDINEPEEARLAALRIGILLRSTGKVKKILGAIRQDLNVSIKGGARIEIKGVQKLDWIPILIRNEVTRQLALLDIRNEMLKRKLTPTSFTDNPLDITEIFQETKCKFVRNGVKKGKLVWGWRVPNMHALWGEEIQEGRRFGTEIASKMGSITGLKGLIHSDEVLSKYQFSESEILDIKKSLKCDEKDLFVLILGKPDRLFQAFEIVRDRLIKALEGVPEETRKALEDGNTEFLRELHGAKRLYPDTDSREIPISSEKLKQIQANLPRYPWEVMKEFEKRYKIPHESLEQLTLDGNLQLLEEILKVYSGKPTIIVSTLLETIKTLRRDGKEVENLKDSHFVRIFELLEKKLIAKEAIEEILAYLCDQPQSTIKDAMQTMDITSMSIEELRKIVQSLMPSFVSLIRERQMGAMGPIMGEVMKEVRGKIDGKIVSQVVKSEMTNLLKKEEE
ncbi:MAG: Glu-tRNA(Gln) amidotransferase subunit GatE [Candidatus Lokiarchaeota archaeon]|nr:Glu-tRNA(Gln) amidotransferase subunit GatE [Candidatus Lokiarchaeota archaeon]